MLARAEKGVWRRSCIRLLGQRGENEKSRAPTEAEELFSLFSLLHTASMGLK